MANKVVSQEEFLIEGTRAKVIAELEALREYYSNLLDDGGFDDCTADRALEAAIDAVKNLSL